MRAPSSIALRGSVFAAFLATAIAGWKLADHTPAPSSNSTTAADGKSATRTARDAGPSAEVKAVLAAIRDEKDPVRRMQMVIALANTLPLDQVKEWLDHGWHEGMGGYEVTLFALTARQRWRREDPAGEFQYAYKSNDGMISASVTEWAKSDPTTLWALLKKSPSQDYMEFTALRTIAEKNPGLALSCLQELFLVSGRNPPNATLAGSLLRSLADKDPQAIIASLESMPPDLRARAEDALASRGLADDFAAQLRKLAGTGTGAKALERILKVAPHTPLDPGQVLAAGELLNRECRNVLAEEANSYIDAANAAKWLDADLGAAGFTAEETAQIRERAIESLFKTDPQRALDLLEKEPAAESLKKQAQLLARMFAQERNVAKRKALIAQLDDEEVRAEVDRRLSSLNGETPPRPPGPDEWLAMATAAGEKDLSNLGQALASWTPQEIGSFTTRFQDMPATEKQATAQLLSRGYTGSSGKILALKGEALRYLLQNPPPAVEGGVANSPERQAVFHAERWVTHDPDAATRWIQSLPEGESKLWTQKNTAASWARYDPEAAKRWVSSLPPESKAAVQEFMSSPLRRR